MSEEIKELNENDLLRQRIVELETELANTTDQFPRLDLVIRTLSRRCDELVGQLREANAQKLELATQAVKIGEELRAERVKNSKVR